MGVSVSAMYGRQFPSVYAGVYAMDCRCTIPNQTTGIGHSANRQATVVSWATCISIDCECFFYRFTLDNIMAMVAPGGYMEQRMGGGVIHYSNEWRPGGVWCIYAVSIYGDEKYGSTMCNLMVRYRNDCDLLSTRSNYNSM